MADRASRTRQAPKKVSELGATPAKAVQAEQEQEQEAQLARLRAAAAVTAAQERREVALTAAALVYRGRRRRSSVHRVLEAAALFESYVETGVIPDP